MFHQYEYFRCKCETLIVDLLNITASEDADVADFYPVSQNNKGASTLETGAIIGKIGKQYSALYQGLQRQEPYNVLKTFLISHIISISTQGIILNNKTHSDLPEDDLSKSARKNQFHRDQNSFQDVLLDTYTF